MTCSKVWFCDIVKETAFSTQRQKELFSRV